MTFEERNEHLLATAMAVFSRHGYHHAKMTKIAEEAGIGAGSIYLHFPSKEKLLEELFLRSWTRIHSQVESVRIGADATPADKIRAIIAFLVSLARENPDMASIFLHEHRFWSNGPSPSLEAMVKATKQDLIGIYLQGIERGEFRRDLDAEMAAEMTFGALWHLLALWSESPSRLNEPDLVDRLHAIIIHGLLH